MEGARRPKLVQQIRDNMKNKVPTSGKPITVWLAMLALCLGLLHQARAAQVLISSNLVIAAGIGKRVPVGDEWVVIPGVSITVDGLLIVDGILTVQGSLNNNGAITNNGTIDVEATFNNVGDTTNFGLL